MVEPTIQRYRIDMGHRGASYGIKECETGELYRVCDVESYVAAKVAQARQDIREQEAKPLMDAANTLMPHINETSLNHRNAESHYERAVLKLRDAIAVVEKVQKADLPSPTGYPGCQKCSMIREECTSCDGFLEWKKAQEGQL